MSNKNFAALSFDPAIHGRRGLDPDLRRVDITHFTVTLNDRKQNGTVSGNGISEKKYFDGHVANLRLSGQNRSDGSVGSAAGIANF